MGLRVDSRDVLDTNGVVRERFRGQVTGHFRRTGPNRWDEFELVRGEGDVIEVFAGIPVYVEEVDVEFRMRSHGKVLTVRWLPSDEEAAPLVGASEAEVRAAFLDRYIKPFGDAPALGAGAIIVKNLAERD
jgi:hypothetical protein